jgi:hypothetical protein
MLPMLFGFVLSRFRLRRRGRPRHHRAGLRRASAALAASSLCRWRQIWCAPTQQIGLRRRESVAPGTAAAPGAAGQEDASSSFVRRARPIRPETTWGRLLPAQAQVAYVDPKLVLY